MREPKAKRAESVAKRRPLTRRAFLEAARRRKNHAVILNGVSPWAKAGAKRSEEPSPRDSAWAKVGAILKVTWAEAVWSEHAHARPHRLRLFQSAILRCVPVAKPPRTPLRMTAGFWCAVARSVASALLQRPQKRHAIELPFAATHGAGFGDLARHPRTSFSNRFALRFTSGGFHRCPKLLRVPGMVKLWNGFW